MLSACGETPAAGQRTGKERVVDLNDPRSVLGLPLTGRVSPRALEAAFRRELMTWHPDHNQEAAADAAERTRAILSAYKRMRGDS